MRWVRNKGGEKSLANTLNIWWGGRASGGRGVVRISSSSHLGFAPPRPPPPPPPRIVAAKATHNRGAIVEAWNLRLNLDWQTDRDRLRSFCVLYRVGNLLNSSQIFWLESDISTCVEFNSKFGSKTNSFTNKWVGRRTDSSQDTDSTHSGWLIHLDCQPQCCTV